jgi:integrase
VPHVGHTCGMAWAELLPSGRYRGVYRDTQKKRRSAGTYSHKSEAERKAGAAEDKARKSSWADPDAGKRPWGEWADEWWPTRGKAPSTMKVDANRRKVHLDPRWAAVPIGSIRRHDIRSWAATMARRGTGASTVQRAVHLLSASLAAAVDAEVLPANPAARLVLPSGAISQERYLTRDEYELLLAQMPTTHDQLIVHLLTYTGLRWGEMAGLHWDRVDLERGVLRVAETWDEKDGAVAPYPKGKKVRDVPIPGWLAALLDEQPRTKVCGQRHVAGRCRSGLVLTTPGGSVLRNPKWSAVWREAVDLADIGEVRIHDCRHTYASWLIQAGVPLARVGQLMGHVSTATTQKYAHLDDAPADEVMAALTAPGEVAPKLPHEALDREAS